MNLEIAQHIIEQEALPILIANPNLKFNLTYGCQLFQIFKINMSQIVTLDAYLLSTSINQYYYYIFKIDHPVHGIGYYKISGYYDRDLGYNIHSEAEMLN